MYNVLSSECSIGSMKLKNRIVMAPMGNLADVDGGFSKRQIDYYAERAKGGAGMIVSGSLLFTSKFGGSFAGIFETMNHVGRVTELADTVHRYGSKLALQFNLGGGRCGGRLSASEVPTVADPNVLCRAMTIDEIHFLVEQIGKTAKLAQQAGVDAILLHAYAGYLLDQFQSSEWNHRTDEYGGSIENRMRFTSELIQSIKKACGKDFPVIAKFSVDHGTQTGRKLEEGLDMCEILEAAGADAIQVDTGSFQTQWNRCIPTVYDPEGYSLYAAKKVKDVVTIPVLGQNKLSDPAKASQAILDGCCDFIAMGHALLTDPAWLKKVEEGKLEDIRPCIGCNNCLLSVNTGKYFHCSVNPYLSHEQDASYKVTKAVNKKKVLIVGGGPAGMSAALAAAEAGHSVELWEKGECLGGNMIAAGAPSFKTDVRRFVTYMDRQVRKQQVMVKLNKEATAEMIQAEGFDRVILASGAYAKTLPVEGAKGGNVYLSLDVLRKKEKLGKRVVIIGGGLVGCELACSAAETAEDVTILEFLPSLMSVGEEARNNGIAIRKLIQKCGVKAICNAAVTAIDEEGVSYQVDGKEEKLPCDSVVLATGFVSDNVLEKELKASGVKVCVVGDASAPRKIGNAIREGLFAIIDMEE